MPIPFPGAMPVQTPLTSPATAEWANAITLRAPAYFASTALRDTILTSPQVGQLCVITAGADIGLWSWNGTEWEPPGAGPHGLIVPPLVKTADQLSIGTTQTAITGLQTASMIPKPQRWLRLSLSLKWDGTDVGDFPSVFIMSGTTQLQEGRARVNAAGQSVSMEVTAWHDTSIGPTARVFGVQVRRNTGGSGTVGVRASATEPATLTIEDMGGS